MAQKLSSVRLEAAVIEYYAPEPATPIAASPAEPLSALDQMFGYYGTR